MDRRGFLSCCGVSFAGLAGCTAPRDSRPTTETDSDARNFTESETQTTTLPDSDIRVEYSGLQAGVVTLFVDAYELVSDPGFQYLFLDVAVMSGRPPPPEAFGFRFDDEEYSPKTEWNHLPLHRGEKSSRDYPDGTGEGRYTGEDDGSGWIVFQLPETGDASDARLTWPGGEWRPDEDVRTRIGAPLPRLGIEAWTVPETVSPDTNPVFEFTVANEGNRPGHFVGAINGRGVSTNRVVTLVSHRIPAAATESWQVTGGTGQIPPEDFLNESSKNEVTIPYTLLWPGENISRTTRVTYE